MLLTFYARLTLRFSAGSTMRSNTTSVRSPPADEDVPFELTVPVSFPSDSSSTMWVVESIASHCSWELCTTGVCHMHQVNTALMPKSCS